MSLAERTLVRFGLPEQDASELCQDLRTLRAEWRKSPRAVVRAFVVTMLERGS